MTTTAPVLKSIHELRKHEGPIYIANNTPNRVHCHQKIGDKEVNFELDPQGGVDSVQMVPKLALEVRGIQKMWLRGDLTVSTDEAMEDQIALLLNGNVAAPQDRLNQIMARDGGSEAQIEGSNLNKSLVEKACAECGHYDPKTGVITRGRTVMSMRDVNDGVPPLCSAHTNMTTEFVPRLVDDGEGKHHWEFDRVSVTATERGKH